MKSWITWLSVGVLSTAVASTGVISYLAWDSIIARSELSRSPIAAASGAQSASPSPSASEPATATQITTQITTQTTARSVSASQPVAQLAVQSDSPLSSLTQPENNYLYDLTQALEPAEEARLSSEQKLEIANNVLDWLKQGVDYWGVREKFDAAYSSQLAGNYAHNRDVYIRFATEWLAPDHLATLKQPTPVAEIPDPAPVAAASRRDFSEFAAEPYPEPPPYVSEYPPRPYYPYPPMYRRAYSRF